VKDIKKSEMVTNNSNTVSKNFYSFLLGMVILLFLLIVSRYNYLLFHTLAELFSILIAWSLFIIVWNTREIIKNDALVCLGIAYLFIGGLHLGHTLSYKGMGILGTELGANPATQLWVIARYMESMTLCLFPFLFGKRIKFLIPLGAYSIITALAFLSIFSWNIFPDCFLEEEGLTLFKKSSEYIICMILAGSLFFLSKKKNYLNPGVYKLLAASIVMTILGELAFTFYVSVYGLSNLVGHFFKLIAFFLIYLALIRSGLKLPYNTLFRELKNSEKEMKSIFRAAPTGIGVVCDRALHQVNDRFCEMTGYSKNELIGQSARIIYPTDKEFEYVGKEKYRQISKKGTGTVETKFKCKDGKTIDVLLSSTPIDLDDLSKGVTFTALDLSNLKAKESELSESKEKYRAMMEAMDDAAYICSSEYLIEYMNPAMVKRTGRDAIGEPCHKAVHGRDEKCPWCFHEKVMQGKTVKIEIVSPRDQKSYHISSSPIRHADDSVSMLAVFRDMSEFKKMETHLQQAQKMEAIGTLAGGIAHDFNNILFPIMGHTEMLLEDIPQNSPFHTSLSEIHTSALRARDLVKQILTFSRQEKNELKLMKMQPLIKEALKLIRSTIPATIKINQDIQADCGVIKADPTQIHQVVMNLATNAYHAMEETGGEMIVSLKEIQLGKDDMISADMTPGVYACVTVADTGVGMDKNMTEKIFDPFFTTKEKSKGTGMGLSVVHGIVKGMGGAIQVYSEPGKGTEFHVYFPMEPHSFQKEITHSNTEIQGGTEQILLVDDEQAILTMEEQMLERLGYQVTSRTSSLEALEAFRANPDKFDLVITDMAMPNMAGDQLAAELVGIRPDIPILLCTGFSTIMSEEQAALQGIKGFLMKPVLMQDFSQKIRKGLESKERSVKK
jgi:PAS domain S-box-containing protein